MSDLSLRLFALFFFCIVFVGLWNFNLWDSSQDWLDYDVQLDEKAISATQVMIKHGNFASDTAVVTADSLVVEDDGWRVQGNVQLQNSDYAIWAQSAFLGKITISLQQARLQRKDEDISVQAQLLLLDQDLDEISAFSQVQAQTADWNITRANFFKQNAAGDILITVNADAPRAIAVRKATQSTILAREILIEGDNFSIKDGEIEVKL